MMTGLILWLAVGAMYVLTLEWRIARRYQGGREELEIKAGWYVTPQFRAVQRVMMVVTWPYWAGRELRAYGRMLVILLTLLGRRAKSAVWRTR